MNKLQKIIISLILLSAMFSGLYLIWLKREEVVRQLSQLGLYQRLQSIGLLRTTIPGYFDALRSQNLAYDLDGDGEVTGKDYPLLVKDLFPDATSSETRVSAVTALAADEVPAESENVDLPSVRGYSTDEFTGSATATYPFDLPVGRAGMKPSLSLSYSSGAVDDMFAGVSTDYRSDPDHNYQKQAGIFGLGWSLQGLGYVARDTQGTLNDPRDDTFILVFSGGVADLVNESDDGFYSVWRTVPNLKMKVERWSRCKNHPYGNTGDNIDICRFNWKVTTPDGTKYYFGSPATVNLWQSQYDPDTSYFAQGSGNDWYPLLENAGNMEGSRAWLIFGSTYKNWHALTYQWLLTKVESVYDGVSGQNVETNYSYQFELGDYQGKKYVKAIYPYKITYEPNEIEFFREGRLDYKTHYGGKSDPDQPLVSSERIRKIVVSSLGKPRNSYILQYKYGWEPLKHNDNGNGIAEYDWEIKDGQTIHSLLEKITPWSGDPEL
jgi:hypothetical protein